MSNPMTPHPAAETSGTVEKLIARFTEQFNNCVDLAAMKSGADREAWIDDAEHCRQAIVALNGISQLEREKAELMQALRWTKTIALRFCAKPCSSESEPCDHDYCVQMRKIEARLKRGTLMAHNNVKNWNSKGVRPCDWCGELLGKGQKYIHPNCYELEARFYTQLGYDGDTDVKAPDGYEIVIPRGR